MSLSLSSYMACCKYSRSTRNEFDLIDFHTPCSVSRLSASAAGLSFIAANTAHGEKVKGRVKCLIVNEGIVYGLYCCSLAT